MEGPRSPSRTRGRGDGGGGRKGSEGFSERVTEEPGALSETSRLPHGPPGSLPLPPRPSPPAPTPREGALPRRPGGRLPRFCDFFFLSYELSPKRAPYSRCSSLARRRRPPGPRRGEGSPSGGRGSAAAPRILPAPSLPRPPGRPTPPASWPGRSLDGSSRGAAGPRKPAGPGTDDPRGLLRPRRRRPRLPSARSRGPAAAAQEMPPPRLPSPSVQTVTAAAASPPPGPAAAAAPGARRRPHPTSSRRRPRLASGGSPCPVRGRSGSPAPAAAGRRRAARG